MYLRNYGNLSTNKMVHVTKTGSCLGPQSLGGPLTSNPQIPNNQKKNCLIKAPSSKTQLLLLPTCFVVLKP